MLFHRPNQNGIYSVDYAQRKVLLYEDPRVVNVAVGISDQEHLRIETDIEAVSSPLSTTSDAALKVLGHQSCFSLRES